MSNNVKPDNDCYLIRAGEDYPHSLHRDRAHAEKRLAAERAEDPAKWEGAQIVRCADWFDAKELRYLNQPLQEVTEEKFHEMLGMLPPADWHTAGGVNRFCMCEMQFNRITMQYAAAGGRHFAKFVRLGDRSTYVDAVMIAEHDARREGSTARHVFTYGGFAFWRDASGHWNVTRPGENAPHCAYASPEAIAQLKGLDTASADWRRCSRGG